jgi:hypothetical protein
MARLTGTATGAAALPSPPCRGAAGRGPGDSTPAALSISSLTAVGESLSPPVSPPPVSMSLVSMSASVIVCVTGTSVYK